MARREVISTFERVTPFRGAGLAYWFSWSAVAVSAYLILEMLSQFGDETFTLGTRILTFSIAAVPVIGIALTNELKRSWRRVSGLFWDDSGEFDQWFESESRFLFTLSSWRSRATVVAIEVLAFGTLWLMGFFEKLELPTLELSTLFGLALFAVICWMCGQALFMCVGSVVELHRLVQRPMKLPFFYPPTRAIRPITGFYTLLAIAVLGAYVGLVVAIWQGPYGLEGVMNVWVTITGIVPLAVLALSLYMIRGAIAAAKDKSVALINAEVLSALNSVRTDGKKDAIERLEKLMLLHDKVESMREWPLAVSNAITLAVALAAAIVQVVLAVAELRGR